MNGTRIFGVAALGAVLVLTAAVERAEALSLSNPAASVAAQDAAKVTTEVRWHYHHHWRHWYRWHHRHWYGWHRWHHRHWR
jgi:hypothetical protein